MARRGHTAENNARSGRLRAPRACAASPRSFPPPRGRCAPRKSRRASPMRTSGTVPETRRQRHCARGAAEGGMLHTRPLIRGRAPPTLAEGQPEAARGSRGRSPLRLLSPISCPHKKWGRLPGRDPATPPLNERQTQNFRDAKKPLCGGFPLVAPPYRRNRSARSARRKETALRRFLCRETCIYLTKPRDGFRALLTRPVQAVVGVGKN